jgi:hypothetical protein
MYVATYATAALDVSIENGQAYIVDAGSMTILDIQNPSQPKLQMRYTPDRFSTVRIRVGGGIAYVVGVMYTGEKNIRLRVSTNGLIKRMA